MSRSDLTPVILYEDNHLLIALKPPGVLAQADGSATPDMLGLLKADIKIRFQKPGEVFLGLVHRLDQPVGGVMAFARTSKCASRLSAQVRDHQLAKYYLAVVQGCPQPVSGCLHDHLLQDPATRQVRVVPAGQGQPAWLDYCVLETRSDLNRSLVAIRLGTGRGHQIRVQFASRRWPLIGDRRYGAAGVRPAGKPEDIALFACLLGLYHPTTREWLEFAAQPPAGPPWSDFRQPDPRALTQLVPQSCRPAGLAQPENYDIMETAGIDPD